MSERSRIRIDRLSIQQSDGHWWVCDWVADTYGNSVIERSLFAFKTKRHAEQFVTAAKRMAAAITPTPIREDGCPICGVRLHKCDTTPCDEPLCPIPVEENEIVTTNTPVTLVQPCPPHQWAHAPTVGYFRCGKCGEQINYDDPRYDEMSKSQQP